MQIDFKYIENLKRIYIKAFINYDFETTKKIKQQIYALNLPVQRIDKIWTSISTCALSTRNYRIYEYKLRNKIEL